MALGDAPTAAGDPGLGCYGWRLDGLTGADDVLSPAPPGAPVLTVRLAAEGTDIEADHVTPDRAELRLQGGGHVLLEREPALARLALPGPGPVDHRHVVHPYLSTTAAVLAWWAGRDSFHAGAFEVDGCAWGVLGSKGRGKSTLMAVLAGLGVPVLADDLVVIADGAVLRGPRCVDLRPDAAERLGVGEPLGVVGARHRSRMLLGDAPASAPLAGWVFPEWGSATSVTSIPVSERIPRLAEHKSLRLPTRQPAQFLGYAALPAYAFVRPLDWTSVRDTTEALLRGLQTAAP